MTASRAEASVDREDMVVGDGQLPTAAEAGVPVEVQWLVEVLVKYRLDEVSI